MNCLQKFHLLPLLESFVLEWRELLKAQNIKVTAGISDELIYAQI